MHRTLRVGRYAICFCGSHQVATLCCVLCVWGNQTEFQIADAVSSRIIGTGERASNSLLRWAVRMARGTYRAGACVCHRTGGAVIKDLQQRSGARIKVGALPHQVPFLFILYTQHTVVRFVIVLLSLFSAGR
jgi:hypothetical protein